MTMTISQALRRIKKVKGELEVQTSFASSAISFKEKQEPAFRFGPTVEKMTKLRTELIHLETQVALTNAQTRIGKDLPITLTQATKKLRELKSEIAWYKGLTVRNHPQSTEEESSYDYDTEKHVRREVKWVCDLPLPKREEMVATLQAEFDKLNDAVETANHRTELVSL